MNRRGALLLALVAFGALSGDASAMKWVPPQRIVDLHVDLSYRVGYQGGTLASGSGQMVGKQALAAGVVGVVLPLFVPHRVSPTGPRAEDLESSYARLMELIPKTAPYSLTGCDPAPGDGSIHTWFAFEGSAPLASEDGAVEKWVKRGARIFGLVHTTDNALATSSTNKNTKGKGLTELGRAFVQRVHKAGGVIDVSHASDDAFDEVIAIALHDGARVVATHSNARALAPHPRNLTDRQLRMIAETGGVVGVNFHSPFLVSSGRARIRDVARHVRHMVAVMGEDHVAIGSDFEGDITPPVGLESAERLPALLGELNLSGLGVGKDAGEKILADNALRILCPAKPAR
jgi:membrane dipeptidase